MMYLGSFVILGLSPAFFCSLYVILQAPWTLAAIELLVMTLLYVLFVPNPLIWSRPISHWTYHFNSSCEDVVVLSYVRCIAIVLAYSLGSSHYHRSVC